MGKMIVIYELKGRGLALKKLKKALSLSEEKYCEVSSVYQKGIEVISEIKIVE